MDDAFFVVLRNDEQSLGLLPVITTTDRTMRTLSLIMTKALRSMHSAMRKRGDDSETEKKVRFV